MSEKAVQAASFKVIGCEADWRETRQRLMGVSETLKRACNLVWRAWMRWHEDAGSGPALAVWMDELRAWHKASKAERNGKPTCDVKPVSNECAKAIYRAVHDAFPRLHNRCLELTRDLTQKRIRKLKPFHGSFPGWMRVLTNEDRPAFSSKPQPIPFDKANSELVADGDVWKLKIRLQRLEGGKSVQDTLTLQTQKRGCASQRAWLEKIAAGECEFKGSKLKYRGGQWYADISFQRPKEQGCALNPERVAVLHAGLGRPWLLRIDGYNWWIGGRTGKQVFHVRRGLLTQRFARQENYKVASSARKKGRKRAYEAWIPKFQHRWHDFVKTYNEAVTWDVIRLCEEHNCGTVVYFQPGGERRLDRFLSTAGKLPGRQDATLWDWAQVAALLRRKCVEKGIEVVVRKTGEAKSSAPKGRKAKRRKGKR